MINRGKAWELLKPSIAQGVPKHWPFHSGYHLKQIDPTRMHKLPEDLRTMYYVLEKWRNFAYDRTSGLGDLVASPYESPNNSPDLCLEAAKDIVAILENYRLVRAYFWRLLRRKFPVLKGQTIEILTRSNGECYAVTHTDHEALNKEGFGFTVSISRKAA